MKVLLVSLYHPELVRGGTQQIAYELFQGLQALPDVEATLLASADGTTPAVFKTAASITGFDRRPDEFLFLSRDYDFGWEKNPNAGLLEAFQEFLTLISPDVVHFHHFRTFGIDYLTLTRRVLPHAKIVFTAHEFLTICAADGHMVRLTDQSLCNRASAVRCHQCLPARPPEHYFAREMWMKSHLAAVDVFTTPSRFMIQQFTRWGLEVARFAHVPNGQEIRRGSPDPARARRNRFGFFGQLVDAKGLRVILDAVSLLRAEGFTDFVVEINGDNIQFASAAWRAEVEAALAREAALPLAARNLVYNGSYHHDQLESRMSRIDWCIVPSVWWEIFCLVVSEAWIFGRPVIASNTGGLAERVTDGVDGLLFEMGDARALAEAMRRASTEEGLWQRLAAGIKPPITRSEMTEGYMRVYREASARLAAAE